jgi:hypothetical protein
MQFVVFLFIYSLFGYAHQSSLAPSGKELVWNNPSIPIAIKTNTSDLTSNQVRSIIQTSMDQWSSNNSAGSIQKATVKLNDDYTFKATPGFYSEKTLYLGDVVTHELGHLLGLSHSEVLNSSMFYSSFSGQSDLSFDDISGVRQKYSSSFGVIRGRVQGGNSIGVLGAHVQAISRRTGESSGVVTDEKGRFVLGGLDLNDTYYLYTSPIKKQESLPGYFANIQSDFCPAKYVGSFFDACGRENEGKPQGISLTNSNPFVDVGVVTINCSLRSDPEYDFQKVKDNFDPVVIYDYGIEQRYEKAFTGWFKKNTSISTWTSSDVLQIDLTSFNELGGNPKYLKIQLVSYPFGSQLEYEMDISQNGSPVPSASKWMTQSPITQTFWPDFSSMLPLGAPITNNFELNIRARKLDSTLVAQTFPASDLFSSSQHLPYLIIASLWELTPSGMRPMIDNVVNLSDNSSCLDAPFTYAVSRAVEKNEDSSSSGNQAAAAGCGTIEPPQNGPGSAPFILALGFMLSTFLSTILKSSKKFLS